MPRGQRSCLIHSVLPNTCHSRGAVASGGAGHERGDEEGDTGRGRGDSGPVPSKKGCLAMGCARAGLGFTTTPHHSFTKCAQAVCYVLGIIIVARNKKSK